jgi:hypothetical protein
VDGFDETLFEELRRMTPAERLALNDRTIRMIEELRRGFAVARSMATPSRSWSWSCSSS